jgi:hypothetical protein
MGRRRSGMTQTLTTTGIIRTVDGEEMQKALLTFLAASAAFLLVPHAAEAHHGWLEFDPNHEVTFEGTVTDFHYTNPHCVVEFDVKDEKGQVHKWQGEFSNPTQLSRKGWTPASLQAGDKVAISGNPARDNGPAMHVTRIRMPNGQEFKVEGGR